MKSRLNFYLLIIASVISAASTVSGTTYTFTTIDVPGALETEPRGINGPGNIVGEYFDGTRYRGFLYAGGSFTTIDVPGDTTLTIPYGINNSGNIVGFYQAWQDAHLLNRGFLYAGGNFTTIDVPGASVTEGALGISNSGNIVGWYRDDENSYYHPHGFVYSEGNFTTIDVPGGVICDPLSPCSWTIPYGINNSGNIVGSYVDSNGNSRSFFYSGGNFTTIDVPGATRTSAVGINNSDNIVGWYFDGTRYHGFLYSGGNFTTIDFPDAYSTWPTGINDSGKIAGSYFDAAGGAHGFVADPAPPKLFVVVPGINDHGEMMVWRGVNMLRDDEECLVRICEANRGQDCDIVGPSEEQIRQKISEATKKAKEKGKDIIVDIDMDLENFSVEYIIPHSRWDQSVGWAGWVANIVPDAFMQENPNGFRMLYAHSAGVDATNSSLKEAKRKRMYDDLNLLNGRTDVQSLRKNLKKQGYEWWRVKVFTAKGDLPAMSPLKILPWLKYEGSLSNYDAAASGAGTAWVHLHCLDDVGHSGLRDSIEANGTEVALPFQVNLGALGKWDNIVRTVPEMMLMDWSSFLAQH